MEKNMTTTMELITPEIAKKYLEKNIVNRPLRGTALSSLVRDMKNGNFKTTHQGIAFDRYGNLIDGQHRLTACALSGVPIRVQVTRGMEKEDGAYIDIGAKRSFHDALTIGEEYADSPALRSKSTASTLRQMVRYGFSASYSLTYDEMRVLFAKYKDELTAIYKATACRSGKPTAVVNAAGLAALICGEDAGSVYGFYTVFINGDSSKLGEYNCAAAYVWQKTIMESKLRRDFIPKNDLYNGTQNAIWQFIHGESTKLIRPTKTLRYPVYRQIHDILNIGGEEV